MHVNVRSAVLDDEEQVVALWQACGLVAPYNDPHADFRFAKARECSDVLIGEATSGRVHAVVMVGHDGHRGWLYYVAADPESRGVGLGRRMVDAAETWLRARGIHKVQLLVRETNSEVIAFYRKLGFAMLPRTVMAKSLF